MFSSLTPLPPTRKSALSPNLHRQTRRHALGLLGPTFEVVGLEKAKITIEGSGVKSVFKAEGIGEGHGDSFKNPVTGEDHQAIVDLPGGFIWTKGECGQGTYHASASGVSIAAQKTNWILYAFDWSNA